MFPLLIPISIGAVAGAAMNKKNPLQGAVMGGALGATGGGLLGAGGAAAGAGASAAGSGTAGGLLSTGMAEGGAASLGSLGSGLSGIPASALGGSASAAPSVAASGAAAPTGFAGFMETAKPVMSAASTGLQVAKQVGPEEQPLPPPPQLPTIMPNNGLGQMVANIDQIKNNQFMQNDMQRQQRRQQMWG